MSSIIEFNHVTDTGKKSILEDISFSLEKGYIMGLAGKNGAGKTTLIKHIISNDFSYNGKILYEGNDVRNCRNTMMQHTSYVSDEQIFFTERDAVCNGEIYSCFYEDWDEQLYMQMLKQFEVNPYTPVYNLSRGNYIKFQLAFAFAHKCSLLLLDEATAGMDPIFRKDFFRILQNEVARTELTVIMATHIEDELYKKSDYIGIMENGRLKSFNTAV